MKAKEVKAILANEAVQAAIKKEVAKAVKAETKRIVNVVKAAKLPDDKAAAKAVKKALKDIILDIKTMPVVVKA